MSQYLASQCPLYMLHLSKQEVDHTVSRSAIHMLWCHRPMQRSQYKLPQNGHLPMYCTQVQAEGSTISICCQVLEDNIHHISGLQRHKSLPCHRVRG